MAETSLENDPIEVLPASAERWNDLETVFGPRGAYAGCWCMFWRLKRSEFNQLTKEERKARLRELTTHTLPPGVIAYTKGQPIGWCAVGPRQDFPPMATSKTLKPIDNLPVWSVVCFFVVKSHRRQGVMVELLRGAVRFAAEHGASIVEGYPLDMQSHPLTSQRLSGYAGYMGIASAFRLAGFSEAARASETQLIMRCVIER